MNKIVNLLKKPFFTCSPEEKKEIKNLGRPVPSLDVRQQQKGRVRKFNQSLYEKNNWLCGCDVVQALFCFPCVLYGGDTTWTKKGIIDLAHIQEKMKVHEKSKAHMNNVFSYSLLGKSNIFSQLNTAYRQSIEAHNEQVDKNRSILNTIINCIRFYGAFELALRGHDESEETLNEGVFRGLIDFSSELDKELKEHFNKGSVFKGISKTIQNELLECMLNVYHEEVAKEVQKSNYVAVIADETTDVSNRFQLVIVLRYIASGKPVERFWNFVNPTVRNAPSIADSILKEIDHLFSGCPEKLIVQSYDGASVMSGVLLNRVQKIIKEKYSQANYIHCYAHQVNSIMSSASAVNKSVKIFFAILSGICTFFSTSAQRTEILDKIVDRKLPQSSQTRWDFHSGGVNTIYEYRNELISVLEAIEDDDDITLQSIIEQANAYKMRLRDPDFIFWLTVFHKIMPHVEIIFKELQTTDTDQIKIKHDLQFFEKQMKEVRDDLDDVINTLEENFADDEPPHKKQRLDSYLNDKKREALEVCDSIIQQIRIRFSFTGHLIATNLFAVEKFSTYRKHFPDDLLKEVVNNYPFLEKSRLKTELMVLFQREELQVVSGAISLLTLVAQDEMRCTFHETLKLLEILVTTPMSTSEAERCFSTLKRIKTFLRNSMKEVGLSALGPLGMLSAEKSFVNNIEDFNKRVIDVFANKEERRTDFTYRSH